MEQLIQVLISGLLSGGIYALASVGLTLIFGIVGLVNFAHGDYLMLAMYIAYWFFSLLGLVPYESMLLNLVIMAVLGYLTYKLLMERVLESSHSIQMLLTLGLSMVLQNLALMLWRADYRNIRVEVTNSTIDIGFLHLGTAKVIGFAVAIVASIILYYFLQKTYTGASMRAVAQNGKAAQLMGINLSRTYCMAFVIGTVLVGLAGLLLSPIYPAYPTIGNSFCTLCFIVVVIGGLSSVPGAIFGGLLIGVVESLAGYYIGSAFQQAAYFLLFILVLVFKPTGLFGHKG
ncbi:MAG: branched-chain amino acid ABC transporter permease [Bacillota bacterium]|nr:branched-chain amino acid ABC transporter permease [Bacillota bacterium]